METKTVTESEAPTALTGSLKIVPTVPQYPTEQDIQNDWNNLLGAEKSGIKHLCTDQAEQATKAVTMAKVLMDKGCKREMAIQLSILALYDLVLLVDNSISMGLPENKNRVETLKSTLKTVSGIYNLVSKNGGIVSVKFLNPSEEYGHEYIKITPGRVSQMIGQVGFRGLTRIGTELRNRILKKFADVDTIKRPVLVMIFTDGEIEGEPDGFLCHVIRSSAAAHEKKAPGGKDLVSYQFVAVGNDPGARKLLDDLDHDLKVGHCIDCFYGEDLDGIQNPDKRWHLLAKLFLGSILQEWDKQSTKADDFKGTADDTLPDMQDGAERPAQELLSEEPEDFLTDIVNQPPRRLGSIRLGKGKGEFN